MIQLSAQADNQGRALLCPYVRRDFQSPAP